MKLVKLFSTVVSTAIIGFMLGLLITNLIVPKTCYDQMPKLECATASMFSVSDKIPKILHQSWKTKHLPVKFASYREQWLKAHPNWIHYLWTDDENREMVRLYYPWFLSYYDAFPVGVMRADAMRYLYMHRYGGLYVDLDFEPLRPLDFLIDNATTPIIVAYLGRSDKNSSYYEHGIPAAFLISEPGHILWMLVIRAIIQAFTTKGKYTFPEDTTGPVIFFKTFSAYVQAMAQYGANWANGTLDKFSSKVGDVTVLAPGLIYPYDWRVAYNGNRNVREFLYAKFCWALSPSFSETRCKQFFPDAYTITYHFRSWGSDWSSFLNG